MSRKDYNAIAAILRDADFGPVVFANPLHDKPYSVTPSDRRLETAQKFAEMFQTDNPRFDRFKFIAAVMDES